MKISRGFWKSFARCPLAPPYRAWALFSALFFFGPSLRAQNPPDAHALVRQVIQNEVVANQNDHIKWTYRDAYKSPEKNIVKLVVETADGTVSRTIESNGRPLTPQEQQADRAQMQRVIDDPSVRARQRKSGEHDSEQALSLLKMLPDGFLWTYGGESNGEITLHFKPNPAFQPPTYASRVFAAMAGDMAVDSAQKRLKVLRGAVIRPVMFGWGLFGKIEPGGTFRVVRSEIAPREWEITQTHVHIRGHILFFKSISQQEDEITSHYRPTPPTLTLQQAAMQLYDGTISRELGASPPK